MLASEFQNYFNHFHHLNKFFDGIFASDEIPNKLRTNHFVICNTDSSNNPGIHWYCMINSNNCIECFDSLGIDNEKKQFLTTLPLITKSNFSEVEFNTTQVQASGSSTCGQFVIYFIIQRLHNQDMDFEDLLNEIFSTDPDKNEQKVKAFLNTHNS